MTFGPYSSLTQACQANDAYYTRFPDPLAISIIKQKEKKRLYSTLKDYVDDWHLLARNTRLHYGEGSDHYNDALCIDRLIDHAMWTHGRDTDLRGADGTSYFCCILESRLIFYRAGQSR